MTGPIGFQKSVCIVIPCYNEEHRLPLQEYSDFTKNNPDALLCFVNDGSSDKTPEILKSLRQIFQDNIVVIESTKNIGKAEAIRKGIHYCNKHYNYTSIAYLDSDLSTSLQECKSLTSYLNDDINFVFGCRMMKIGSVIRRNYFRFLVGRIIATVISNILKLKVYDTQCGCKIFTKDLSVHIFKDPFISRWLFDVEIFQRLIILYGRDRVLKKMVEVPLKRWVNKEGSKVKFKYCFQLWVDLYRINKKYKKDLNTLSYESKMLKKNA